MKEGEVEVAKLGRRGFLRVAGIGGGMAIGVLAGVRLARAIEEATDAEGDS